jgi:hypothetical protein
MKENVVKKLSNTRQFSAMMKDKVSEDPENIDKETLPYY